MNLVIDVERKTDGRWTAEVPELPEVRSHGGSEASTVITAEALALRVLAERLKHGESDGLRL